MGILQGLPSYPKTYPRLLSLDGLGPLASRRRPLPASQHSLSVCLRHFCSVPTPVLGENHISAVHQRTCAHAHSAFPRACRPSVRSHNRHKLTPRTHPVPLGMPSPRAIITQLISTASPPAAAAAVAAAAGGSCPTATAGMAVPSAILLWAPSLPSASTAGGGLDARHSTLTT